MTKRSSLAVQLPVCATRWGARPVLNNVQNGAAFFAGVLTASPLVVEGCLRAVPW